MLQTNLQDASPSEGDGERLEHGSAYSRVSCNHSGCDLSRADVLAIIRSVDERGGARHITFALVAVDRAYRGVGVPSPRRQRRRRVCALVTESVKHREGG